ncbi:MAG: TonB-dependent receptor [Chthoniobacterales bacterium]
MLSLLTSRTLRHALALAFFIPSIVHSQETPATLSEMEVTSQLDAARNDIDASLGATTYQISRTRLDTQSQGEDAPFNQTILRLPGVAQDSYGQLHLRGEHANLQYRIDGVLLPEGISGFGQELDTRFVDSLALITGALPAQFGYRTAGVISITTKSGAALSGGSLSLYGGSHETVQPSLSLGGKTGALEYFFTGSLLHNDLGIENPTGSTRAIHDDTDQGKAFGYLSYVIDPESRLSLLLSASDAHFQIPNNPGQSPAFALDGVSHFDSARLDENQREKNDYAILSYQKTSGRLDYQLSLFTRYSGVAFSPDVAGDLIFNGVASRVDRSIFSNGLQWDGNFTLNDQHTLRGGFIYTAETARFRTTTSVFPVDAVGNQSGTTPIAIADNGHKNGFLYGIYLQDEWHPLNHLTINAGGRFDVVNAYTNENQLSPRLNFVYEATPETTLHLGYARYFTPPPLELVQSGSIAKFAGTSNASEIQTSTPVSSERADYFDAGVTQKLAPGLQVGLDGYYKHAHSQLDEGQFGSALIFSPFNYREGEIYGAELTANYEQGNLSAYANLAWGRATGKTITSGQFQFGPDEIDYISQHSVFLDHDQRVTASCGASYLWRETRFSADFLYGSGLRSGFANSDNLSANATVNLGIEHTWKLGGKNTIKARLDVVNLLDESYELRDGSGIGVGAPQFGPRRGFFGGITWEF